MQKNTKFCRMHSSKCILLEHNAGGFRHQHTNDGTAAIRDVQRHYDKHQLKSSWDLQTTNHKCESGRICWWILQIEKKRLLAVSTRKNVGFNRNQQWRDLLEDSSSELVPILNCTFGLQPRDFHQDWCIEVRLLSTTLSSCGWKGQTCDCTLEINVTRSQSSCPTNTPFG